MPFFLNTFKSRESLKNTHKIRCVGSVLAGASAQQVNKICSLAGQRPHSAVFILCSLVICKSLYLTQQDYRDLGFYRLGNRTGNEHTKCTFFIPSRNSNFYQWSLPYSSTAVSQSAAYYEPLALMILRNL